MFDLTPAGDLLQQNLWCDVIAPHMDNNILLHLRGGGSYGYWSKKNKTKHRVRRSYWHCSDIQLQVPLQGGWHVLLSQWWAAASPSIFFFQGVLHVPNQSSFPPLSPAPALRHVGLQVVPKCSAHFVVDVILHNPCREKKRGKKGKQV